MFFLQFLREKIPPDDQVMLDFVEYLLAKLFERYADISAKGGDQTNNLTVNEETRQKFADKEDQSMVSHLLNGIFPTMHLVRLLQREALGPAFSEVEQRVYIVSYLMHDIDKILMHEAISQGSETAEEFATWSSEKRERSLQLVREQLLKCEVEHFFPDYATYLEDITYLVVNTQRKRGTHLHTYGWRFALPSRQMLWLRELCTYSDKIAYFVPSPSAIAYSDEARLLTTILANLSNDQLVFSYHQLREVRGLLTNVVNTALIHLFTDDRQGIWPYLFFSDGVIYIKRKTLQFFVTTPQLVETVQAQLRHICASVIKQDAPGFKFSIQGIAKHPGYYFEFLTLEEYVQLLIRFTIARTRHDTATIPMDKLRQMQAQGALPADLRFDFQLHGQRVSVMSRFLSVVFTTLPGLLDKTQQKVRVEAEQAVIQQLELTPYWERAKAIPNKGGVEYRWFWLAACYLEDHPGLAIAGEERSLETIFRKTMDRLLETAGDALRARLPQQYLAHLTQYLDSIVEIPLAIHESSTLPDFAAELTRYVQSKDKKRTLLCTLCNSAYPTEEQADNAVLFQPWVYKNKLTLYAGKNAGGICVLCALELMLRQILLRGQLQLTGTRFEAQKAKYLTIYPNFFFTSETGAIVQGIIHQLRAINFFTIRKQLEGKQLADMNVGDLLKLDVFAAPLPTDPDEGVPVEFIDDENNESDSQQEDQDDEARSQTTERGYLKYRPQDFPGLFLFGMRAGKEDNDTAAWAMPAFLALAFPLVTGTKVAISEMSLPLFASGHDFQETVILDAPHPYLERLLRGKRLRVNQLLWKLQVLACAYRVNIDTYAKQGKPEWKHLSALARDLETDPLYLFHYLRKQQRMDSFRAQDAELYLDIYQKVLREDLGKIERCVDNYTKFYRGGYQSHSILKPVDIVAKAIITSPLEIEADDLLWQIQGELKNWLDRVRNHHATGYALFWGKEIDAREEPCLRDFIKGFYEEVFLGYCQGERGLLRNRINRFKDGCEAYYIHQRNARRIQEQTQEPSGEPEAE